MDSDELYAVMGRWVATGHITGSERAGLKADYLRQLGVETCTVCPSFWHDVRTFFLLQLRAAGLPNLMSKRKYLVNGDYLMLPNGSKAIVNEGIDSESVEVLTDEKAEAILEKYPSYAELIVVNPDYVAPAKEAPKQKAA